jgi:hypothetical protein
MAKKTRRQGLTEVWQAYHEAVRTQLLETSVLHDKVAASRGYGRRTSPRQQGGTGAG